MTTQIQHTDRDDAATVTTHDVQMARYSQPYAAPTNEAPDTSEIEQDAPPTLSEVLARLSDARTALKLTGDILNEVTESLSGRSN